MRTEVKIVWSAVFGLLMVWAALAEISGHQSRSVFDRYNIVSTDDVRDALKRTAEYVHSQPERSNVQAIRAPKEGRK